MTSSFWLIPFPILYIWSDILYVFFYYIFGYRKKVIIKNLRNSFPEKSEAEIQKIAKKFYKHLADITLEGIKAFAITKRQMLRRFKITDYEIVQKYYNEGKTIIAYASHYSNWEWGGIGAYVLPHELYALYKPLKNKRIDMYARKSRSTWGANMISITDTYAFFTAPQTKPQIIFMLSDQSPSNQSKSVKVNFLGQATLFLHGTEKYAHQFNYPIVYAHVNRVKRGFYEVRFELVCDNPQSLPDRKLTERYAQILEKQIYERPEEWLWSHKRWKHRVSL